jgi:hypothetical protein
MLTTSYDQAPTDSADPSGACVSGGALQIAKTYKQPTRNATFCNCVKDVFGTSPVAGFASAAGVKQLTNALPDWRQSRGQASSLSTRLHLGKLMVRQLWT